MDRFVELIFSDDVEFAFGDEGFGDVGGAEAGWGVGAVVFDEPDGGALGPVFWWEGVGGFDVFLGGGETENLVKDKIIKIQKIKQ